MNAAIKAAVDDWTAMDVADMWSFTVINDYIEKTRERARLIRHVWTRHAR